MAIWNKNDPNGWGAGAQCVCRYKTNGNLTAQTKQARDREIDLHESKKLANPFLSFPVFT